MKFFQSIDVKPPLKVRSIFLDISKVFDKVWYEGLHCKLSYVKFLGIFYKIITTDSKQISHKFQTVVWNG